MPVRLLLVLALAAVGLFAQQPSKIPTPAEVFGHEIGERHLRPDQIAIYAEKLAAASDRVNFEVYGRTHELRPLVLLTISAPENLAQLDEIRAGREKLWAIEKQDVDLGAMPVVCWMGYSVHGNEPSGASAAIEIAHRLATARDEATLSLLRESVILLEPCMNPDGVARFANWANQNRGQVVVDDPRHREHREPWPRGRTNHYWFDLNRDWLLASQPESQARLEIFQRWRPNLVTDFHEMGTNSTYFFQPGVPSRANPLIPERNQELTREIAKAHAAALDRFGQLYYSEESFDDFYFGKGSTYPDVQGGVGILFEQASARGHAQENDYGGISFQTAIRNQVACSISSLKAAVEKRGELLEHMHDFYAGVPDVVADEDTKAWVFGAPEDRGRAERLVNLFLRHHIEVHRLAATIMREGRRFGEGEAFVVKAEQPQFRLLKSLLLRARSFRDPVFYDVSTWNVVDSFDVVPIELGADASLDDLVGRRVEAPLIRSAAELPIPSTKLPYAYAFDWKGLASARLITRLLGAGFAPMISSEPFTASVAGRPRRFERGAVVIARGMQDWERVGVRSLAEAGRATGVQIHAIGTGLTPEGVDLGSPSVRPIEKPKVLLLVGAGTSAYEAGHVWHFLDDELGMEVTLLDAEDLRGSTLRDYSHLIAVSGARSALGKIEDDLKSWLRAGGTLIAQKSAARWAGTDLLGLDAPKVPAGSPPPAGSYAERAKRRALGRISGAIFRAQLDRTHPLCWGLARDEIALWHAGSRPMAMPRRRLDAVIRYLDEPLSSGFAAPHMQRRFAGSCAASVERYGGGVVVRFNDDMNFRGIWPGTSRLFANAIFMAPLTGNTSSEDGAEEAEEDENSESCH